ncbi:MAG: EAL domain-containing protein, partial [Clostridia bacterium]|nr:EAL domain-containing protein [Clostridia bacterium]
EDLPNGALTVLLAADGPVGPAHRQRTACAAVLALKERIRFEHLRQTGREPEVRAGYAPVDLDLPNPEVHLRQALWEARRRAISPANLETAPLLSELGELIAQARFQTVYQPIVSLRFGSILGWEALTRGPRDSYFHHPEVLFGFAEKAGLLYPLERVCRRLALENLGELAPSQKLFLNLHPRTISDPNFVRGETIKWVEAMGLRPQNIVFEITERHRIEDFLLFNRTLEHYRSQGYLVAVDDAGSGFSSLKTVAEVRPDFIKIDRSLIKQIHLDSLKRALLETLTAFAEKIGSAIIAEGIETEEDLTTLVLTGVHFGQGFFLGRPQYPKPLPEPTVQDKIATLAVRGRYRAFRHVLPVGHLAKKPLTVGREAPLREAWEKLHQDPAAEAVVITQARFPVGLLTRQRLESCLAQPNEEPSLLDRPVVELMDARPLVVEEDVPVEAASLMVTSRPRHRLYDCVVITRDRELTGVLPLQTLLEAMTKIRLEMAKGAGRGGRWQPGRGLRP